MNKNKHQWTAVAVDFNSPFTRNYIFVKSFFSYPNLGAPRIPFAMGAKKNTIEYIPDMLQWQVCHEALKKQVEKDMYFVDKLIDKTMALGEEVNAETERELFKVDLTKVENKELVRKLHNFIDRVGSLYTYGTLLPILDFGGFAFVEGNLNKFLKEKLSAEQYADAYAVFTAPPYNSFQQDQEEDLLCLMEEFFSNEWKKDVETKTLQEIKQKYPTFAEKLKKHTEKYCWVYYVFAGPAFTEQHFLDFMKDYLKKGINPTKKLEEIKEKKKEIKQKKEEYIKKIQPNEFQKMILTVAGKVVWSKPRRKDYQSKSYYHSEKLMREIGNRLGLTLEEARSTPIDMIENALLHEKAVDKEVIKQVYEFHICVPLDNGTVDVLYGKRAEEFYKEVLKENEKVEQKTELKGMCACKGFAKGRVKIVNTTADMEKMEYGDVLVAIATTPAVVPAMKKAAAIVTDEGGLTCHASIVSRELNIPCVVGTKVATKVFKDGDLVEVDATKGIVKKLEQHL